MSGKNNKKIWLSVAALAVCVAVIIAVCIIVFTNNGSDIHIRIEQNTVEVVRGELELSLVREKLETRTLDKRGLIVENTDDKSKDFSYSKDNIFGIDDNMLVGPTCSFTAHMAIANSKPYAFEYWLEIIPVHGDSLLADQLELTVTVEGETFIKRTLQNGLTTKVFPAVSASDTAHFTAKLEYLNVVGNDETKNTTFAFDMIVHARLIAQES